MIVIELNNNLIKKFEVELAVRIVNEYNYR
jgi:hypothetical protein